MIYGIFLVITATAPPCSGFISLSPSIHVNSDVSKSQSCVMQSSYMSANLSLACKTDFDVLDGKQHFLTGLSEDEALERLSIFGPNALPSPKQKVWWELWIEQFEDKLVQILLIVAVISAASSVSDAMGSVELNDNGDIWQSFIEPTVILLILMLNASIGVWQQLSAISSLEALKKLQPKLATVLRKDEKTGEGRWVVGFEAANIVPGDVIEITTGDSIPSDCVITDINSSILSVDESSLSGESVSVGKTALDELVFDDEGKLNVTKVNMVFSGTIVTKGSARAAVLKTGPQTEMGKIQASMISVEEEKTPLNKRLDKFGEDLAKGIAVICAAVWLLSIPRFGSNDFSSTLDGAIYYAKIGVALGVAAIPEGLPAVISLVLALGTRRLAERNVITRNLSSIETLGQVSIICTDKTGTLTTNQMTVVSLVTMERKLDSTIEPVEHPVDGTSYEPIGEVKGFDSGETNRFPPGAVQDIIAVSIGCNDARLVREDDEYFIVGEPTEGALLTLAEKLGSKDRSHSYSPDWTRKVWESEWNRYATLEFDRQRKSMGTICKPTYEIMPSSEHILLVKGAPNLLLQRCSYVKLRDGEVVPLSATLRTSLENEITSLSSKPLRCLLLAVKKIKVDVNGNAPFMKSLSDADCFESIETDLTVVGLVGIKDPPRRDAFHSIALCKKASIRLIMITGDAKDTAIAIAKELNILSPEENETKGNSHLRASGHGTDLKAFDGTEFFSKPESEQLTILQSGNLVFSRVEPTDKQKIVKMLQMLDEIPAMTGDGVNDAPALRQASIGIAMGSGTDVAKEAADMILSDDSFSTIVRGIEEGRCIYANMQAFINFLLSCNIGEVMSVFIATFLGFPSILSAMQLLWVNLITDGPPATALGWNPTDDEVMNAPPRDRDEEFISQWAATRYLVTGSYISLATVGIFSIHYDPSSIHSSITTYTPEVTLASVSDIPNSIATAQTFALSTLITTELLQALSSVSIDTSIFVIGPQRNPILVIAVIIPFMIHLGVLYNPSICAAFGLVPLELDQWVEVFIWSAPILLVEETLKLFTRRKRNESLLQ